MLRHLLRSRISFVQTRNSLQFCSVAQQRLTIELLKSRSLLKVSGEETSIFMQGLITNDMKHLEEGANSMYTMFLNTKGRVLYDAIIYPADEKEAFFIECDSSAATALQKHINLYRVRRKISVENLDNLMGVWVLYNPDILTRQQDHEQELYSKKSFSEVLCSAVEVNSVEKAPSFESCHNLKISRDPRMPELGYRLLADKNKDMKEIAAKEINAQHPTDDVQYKMIRFKLGVGEGVEDLPSGNCFPLEANCDYLHGVSFHKGCYIGQELTARTHHTGVIRKRLMPVEFDSVPTVFTADAPILLPNNCSRPVGKLRSGHGNVGIALLRIAEALDAISLNVLNVKCQTARPSWWPKEAPKERLPRKDISNI